VYRPTDFRLWPNQRLHLTPRLGHRGRDLVCYRFWLLAIQHSFRGAGEPRPLGRAWNRTRVIRKLLEARRCCSANRDAGAVGFLGFSCDGNALLQGLSSCSLAALLNPGKRDRRLGVADLKS
jgi:hypothetical protein